jgi:hypothetical protein
MRNAILKLVLALGRYAVLPVVAVALAVFAAWLIAIDGYPLPALTASPIVVPATTCAVFLAYGLLLLPRRRKAAKGVDEAAAPGVWAIWNEFDRMCAGSRRTLVIDGNVNGSIGEQRRFLGLFGRQVTMTIGLPLLIVLDERAVRAVIAPEIAHAALQHTSGGANLGEFITAAGNIFEYADPETTITGRVSAVLLNALLGWLEKEYLLLSRQNELEADRQAAERVGNQDAARAGAFGRHERAHGRVRLHAAEQGASRRHSGPRAPASTHDQPVGHDPDSTHPSLRQRLANLGFSEIPAIDGIQTPAASSLLADHVFKDLVTRFDSQWSKRMAAHVDIGYR